MPKIKNDTKKTFFKKGTCSQLFCYLINREFDHVKKYEERASDLLAGGILQRGHQCGMLWGATLAAGAESYRRCKDTAIATAMAITTSQHIVASFTKQTNTVNCQEITKCNWKSMFGIAKYLLTGKVFTCYTLAEKWAPQAIQSVKDGLSVQNKTGSHLPLSCASVVAKRMGATDEEMVTVAGFAGGIGLSGNGCGALGAALWMKTLDWCRKNPGKSPPFFNNTNATSLLKAFDIATGCKMLCKDISGQRFRTAENHTEYIKNGGCDALMTILAKS